MRLNPKVYKALVGEPFAVQEIDGKRVEFHYMDDTPYLTQYAARGRFAIWTSDGKDNYKVLIESKYYEALKPFYEQGVNAIWLDFLSKVGAMSRKTNMLFLIPTFLVYAIAFAIIQIFWPEQIMILLVVMLASVFLMNMMQSRYINKKVKEENSNTQQAIKNYVGEDVFEGLVKNQEAFYAEYFKTDEPVEEASTDTTEQEAIEAPESDDIDEGSEEKQDDK